MKVPYFKFVFFTCTEKKSVTKSASQRVSTILTNLNHTEQFTTKSVPQWKSLITITATLIYTANTIISWYRWNS